MLVSDTAVQDDGKRLPPASTPSNAPNPGFLCPLTGIVMRDPVILEASFISFERIAILWWLSVNPDRCPVTGRPVADRTIRDDDELRSAILEWAKRSAPHFLVRSPSMNSACLS
jgi:hypothetical protein